MAHRDYGNATVVQGGAAIVVPGVVHAWGLPVMCLAGAVVLAIALTSFHMYGTVAPGFIDKLGCEIMFGASFVTAVVGAILAMPYKIQQ